MLKAALRSTLQRSTQPARGLKRTHHRNPEPGKAGVTPAPKPPAQQAFRRPALLFCKRANGIRLNEAAKKHKGGLPPEMVKSWLEEMTNPTEPPRYEPVHKVKFLHTFPELDNAWTPQDFIR